MAHGSAALALDRDEASDRADEGSTDASWDEAWLAELDRREQVVRDGGPEGDEWGAVRARIRARLKG